MRYCFDCGTALNLVKRQSWVTYYNCYGCDHGYEFVMHEHMGGCNAFYTMNQLRCRINPLVGIDPRDIRSVWVDHESEFMGVTFREETDNY